MTERSKWDVRPARQYVRVPPRLAEEIGALNPRQREAALQIGNVVIRAGPGSGKTRTLVAKVAYLLAAVVGTRQGVAAMTYTNQAAREVTRRLARLGLRPGRRLVSRTVHSWCLTAILRPYAHLTGIPMPGSGGVIDDGAGLELLQECLDEAHVYEKAAWVQPLITKIRRSVAAGRGIEGFDEAKTDAASMFDKRLIERDLIDYEAMVGRALELLRASAPIRDLVAARFPWLVIDEYQDLGPVLHEIVLTLHERAGVQVCAVGDPDQSVMGFTGADPRYLEELAEREDFLEIDLDLNYRSGSALIAASHAALGAHRDHRADPDRTDRGVLEVVSVAGGLEDHTRLVVTKIRELTAAGVSPGRIAVLYSRRGLLLDLLTQSLGQAGIDFLHERDQRFPTGPLVEFLRRCASRRLAGPQPCGHGLLVDQRVAVPIIHELANEYLHLTSGKRPRLPAIEIGERLEAALDADSGQLESLREERLTSLIQRLDSTLGLAAIAADSQEQRDTTALNRLEQLDADEGLTIEQFAAQDLSLGRVVVTTYHSAKGREFSVVILPGLVEGVVPRLMWSKRRNAYEEPARAVMAEERRAFYVAFTRAADAAMLIYGPGFQTEWGAWNGLGPSRFVVDIVEYLREST